jgi:hypothetical protein
MKCPHCLTEFHAEWTVVMAGQGRYAGFVSEGPKSWRLHDTICPACKKVTLVLEELIEIIDKRVSQ